MQISSNFVNGPTSNN